jgi:type IV secretion system protein TrbL
MAAWGRSIRIGKLHLPGAVVNLGMQVFQNTIKHINFLSVESMAIPVIIALIILIVCALIAVNMILLLCAAWVVLYAGIIFLGFGGCRWTSDMAVNYYRTVLGVGVSLMTMQLIIGLGIKFLQDLVATTGESLDAPSLAIIMVACIILAVIVHRLPQMVAGMVVGGGNNGAVGGIGMMTLVGAGIAGTSIVRSVGAGAGAAAVSEGATASYKLLQERIAGAEAAMAAGSGGAGGLSSASNPVGMDSNRSNPNGGVGWPKSGSGSSSASPQAGANNPRTRTSAATAKDSIKQQSTSGRQIESEVEAANEPPQTRPITPDEQRGFDPPSEPFDWEAERRKRKSGLDPQ